MSRQVQWPPRDWRALIALVASIIGAAVLTGFSIWLVRLLVAFARADPSVRLEVIRALTGHASALVATCVRLAASYQP